MSMRTPLKNRTVKLSITLQEAVNLQTLLVVAMNSLDGGYERYQSTREKLWKAVDDVLEKASKEEENS